MCVDGFSRIIVYAHCASNNRAETVLEQFTLGVQNYGLPSRVRSDHGLENVKVAYFMIEQRGMGRGSMITGSSVHNCRVERAHRDIYAGVLSFFAKTFNELEDSGLLDPLVDLHIFALHYVYIPRINAALKEFKEQWNHHGLRTERSLSPLQLYTEGLLRNVNSGHPTDIGNDFGVDPEGPFPIDNEDYQVAVPEINIQISDAQRAYLFNHCNPLQDDGNAGKNIFVNCKELLLNVFHL